jgi:hypothetical protein
MKNRLDYWHAGTRSAIKLSAYALALIDGHPEGRSAAITAALVAWFGPAPHGAATAFCSEHEGMNLSLLIELAISRHYDPTSS